EAAARVGPGASYYALSMGGAPIGYTASTIDTTVDGIVVQSNTVMDIAVLGAVRKTGTVVKMTLTRTLHLKSFDAQLTSEDSATRYHASGVVDGDTVLTVTIEAGGTQRQRIRLPKPIVMPDLVNLRLAVGGRLEPGSSYTLTTFDPIGLM